MNVHQRMATQLVFNSPSALTNLSYHSLLVLAQKWHRPEDLWQNEFTKSLSQELQLKLELLPCAMDPERRKHCITPWDISYVL